MKRVFSQPMRMSQWSALDQPVETALQDRRRHDLRHQQADAQYGDLRLDDCHIGYDADQHAGVDAGLARPLADETTELVGLGPDDRNNLANLAAGVVVNSATMDLGQVRARVNDGALAQPSLIDPERKFQELVRCQCGDISGGQPEQKFQIFPDDCVIDDPPLQFDRDQVDQRHEHSEKTGPQLVDACHANDISPDSGYRPVIAGALYREWRHCCPAEKPHGA
jgi:hypothetical protein